MKLGIGVGLLALGGFLALLGYAPIGSAYASSLALVLIGGLLIAAGVWEVLMVSAKSYDAAELDDIPKIRP